MRAIMVRNNKGLTLAELLIALFVLAIGTLGILLFYTTAMRSVDYAKDLTVTTTHAEYIFEEMRTRDSLANITATDWSAWAETAGLNTLPSESITVAIVNASDDPLAINTEISWTRNSRDNNVIFATKIHK